MLGQLQQPLGQHGERKGGNNFTQSPACAVIVCLQPYGPRQAGDSSLLPAVVEVSVPQPNPTLAVTILLLTTTTPPDLSAKLFVCFAWSSGIKVSRANSGS